MYVAPDIDEHSATLSQRVIGALILAAGRAQRFGSDKRLYQRPGTDLPMLVATLEGYVHEFAPCFLVVRTGDDAIAHRVQDAYGAQQITILCSQNAHQGMGAALADAVQHIRAEQPLDALFIGLGDMPCIAPQTLARLHREMQDLAGPEALLRPEFQGQPGHPVGFGKHYFGQLAQLSGDRGAASLLQRHAHRLTRVPVPDPGIHQDFDHPV